MLHRTEHFAEVPSECQGGIVSIGNFDGVHLGHTQLVQCLASLARRQGVPAVAFTFEPHPVELLRPDRSPVPLTWTERKAELLQEHGANEVVVIHTNMKLLRLSGDEFFDQIIRGSLGAVGLVEGPNFGFGRNRSGSIATLNRLCSASNIQLEVVDPLQIDGQVISSSRIRECLAAGEVEAACRMLGRPHRVRGRVSCGVGRGAGLGFPTANLVDCNTFAPADGVYAAQAIVGGATWPAAVHIGPNSTFGETSRTIEAHLIGFAGNLVGQTLEIDFHARLRGTQKFSGAAELIEQLHRDVQQAKQFLESG